MKKYNPFKILDFIPFGKENAISMEELAIRIGAWTYAEVLVCFP